MKCFSYLGCSSVVFLKGKESPWYLRPSVALYTNLNIRNRTLWYLKCRKQSDLLSVPYLKCFNLVSYSFLFPDKYSLETNADERTRVGCHADDVCPRRSVHDFSNKNTDIPGNSPQVQNGGGTCYKTEAIIARAKLKHRLFLSQNGLLSALPYLVCWIAISVFSWICDYLTNKGYLSLTSARKVFNSIGKTSHFFYLIKRDVAWTIEMKMIWVLTQRFKHRSLNW